MTVQTIQPEQPPGDDVAVFTGRVDVGVLTEWVEALAITSRGVEQIIDTPFVPASFWPLPRGLQLVDTPGILEAGSAGQEREQRARSQAAQADLLLLVVDGDLRNAEQEVFNALARLGKRLLLVLNKCDLRGQEEERRLLALLRRRCHLARCHIRRLRHCPKHARRLAQSLRSSQGATMHRLQRGRRTAIGNRHGHRIIRSALQLLDVGGQ